MEKRILIVDDPKLLTKRMLKIKRRYKHILPLTQLNLKAFLSFVFLK